MTLRKARSLLKDIKQTKILLRIFFWIGIIGGALAFWSGIYKGAAINWGFASLSGGILDPALAAGSRYLAAWISENSKFQ